MSFHAEWPTVAGESGHYNAEKYSPFLLGFMATTEPYRVSADPTEIVQKALFVLYLITPIGLAEFQPNDGGPTNEVGAKGRRHNSADAQ